VVGRDGEGSLLPGTHIQQAQLPALDHLTDTQPELERLVPLKAVTNKGENWYRAVVGTSTKRLVPLEAVTHKGRVLVVISFRSNNIEKGV